MTENTRVENAVTLAAFAGHFNIPTLSATFTVSVARLPRRPCDACGMDRVRFSVAVNGIPVGKLLCAPCARLR